MPHLVRLAEAQGPTRGIAAAPAPACAAVADLLVAVGAGRGHLQDDVAILVGASLHGEGPIDRAQGSNSNTYAPPKGAFIKRIYICKNGW